MKAQKSLADDYLVALAQDLRAARQQASSAINKCAVRRAQVLDHMNIISKNDPGMASRYFRVGVVGIQIDVRKNSVVRVPAADVRLFGSEWEIGVRRAAAFDRQLCVNSLFLLVAQVVE